MSLVNVLSSIREYQFQVRFVFPANFDDGKTGVMTFTNSDGTQFDLPILSGSSNQITGNNNKSVMESSFEFNERYTVVDVGGGNLHVSQIFNDGPFLVETSQMSGSLSVTSSDVTPAEYPIPRHKLFIASPHAASSGDRYLSRETLRGKSGFYNIVSANTNPNIPHIVVEDSKDLLNPSLGAGLVDDGTITADNGPEWVREALQTASSSNHVVEITDIDYTVSIGDTHINASTTGAGDVTITFGKGSNNQEVVVMQVLRGIDGDVFISGTVADPTLALVGKYARFMYNSLQDKWYSLDTNV